MDFLITILGIDLLFLIQRATGISSFFHFAKTFFKFSSNENDFRLL
jgi:hypothetical protein